MRTIRLSIGLIIALVALPLLLALSLALVLLSLAGLAAWQLFVRVRWKVHKIVTTKRF